MFYCFISFILYQLSGRDRGEFISWTPDDLDIPQEEFLLLVDQNNLEVKLVLKYRKQFLYYLDILDTYEVRISQFYFLGHGSSDDSHLPNFQITLN